MEQQDPVTPESTPPPASSSKMRMIAVGVTAVALLAISIPFVFQAHQDDPAPSAAQTSVTPAASHDVAGAETPACMADAKPANWDFKLKNLEGKEVELSSFKGKVVLLNFWATWCGPCKAEIPGFVELQEKYKDKITIVGYSVDDSAELAKKYAAEY
jgi:thiol-disulfide isomerase/thioredoxin